MATDTSAPAPALTDEQIEPHLALIRSLFILGATPDDAADHAQGIDIFDRTIAAVIARAKREERERIADELAAWLDTEHAPPIWHEAVDIADPTWCDRHPEEATNDTD